MSADKTKSSAAQPRIALFGNEQLCDPNIVCKQPVSATRCICVVMACGDHMVGCLRAAGLARLRLATVVDFVLTVCLSFACIFVAATEHLSLQRPSNVQTLVVTAGAVEQFEASGASANDLARPLVVTAGEGEGTVIGSAAYQVTCSTSRRRRYTPGCPGGTPHLPAGRACSARHRRDRPDHAHFRARGGGRARGGDPRDWSTRQSSSTSRQPAKLVQQCSSWATSGRPVPRARRVEPPSRSPAPRGTASAAAPGSGARPARPRLAARHACGGSVTGDLSARARSPAARRAHWTTVSSQPEKASTRMSMSSLPQKNPLTSQEVVPTTPSPTDRSSAGPPESP